jgi:hypothetical protein
LCWTLTLLLLVATSTLVYLFIVRGETLPAADGRTAIVLDAGERDLVLAEMRDFLVALQAITAATVDDDVAAVVDAASRVGGAAQHSVPASLVGKLPLAFKRLGFDTHSRFDILAENAREFGSTAPVLGDMAALMQNCTGCHAAYRIEVLPQ